MKNTILIFFSMCLIACSGQQQKATILEGDAIIGGKSVQLNDPQFKSVVGIMVTDKDLKGTVAICTGTLIDSSVVLTAAHCIQGMPKDSRFFVIFGTNLFDSTKMTAAREVTLGIVHELYSGNKFRNAYDVGLIRFKGVAPADAVIAPILKDYSFLRRGTSLVTAGYGRNSRFFEQGSGQLRSVKITISDEDFSSTEFSTSQYFKGICSGDSGGPAFAKINGQFFVAGISNRGLGIGPADCILSAYFARVDRFQDWITQNVKLLKAY